MNDAPAAETPVDAKVHNVVTDGPPKKATPKKAPAKPKGGGKNKAAAKPAPTRKSAATKAPKLPSKADTVIALLRREAGATMIEMQEATSWKPHSVRAFISAGLKKKGLQVTKQKHDGGMPTTFHLPEPAEAI